jgi:hypothetical protein
MIFSGSKALKGRADEGFGGPGGKMVSARVDTPYHGRRRDPDGDWRT